MDWIEAARTGNVEELQKILKENTVNDLVDDSRLTPLHHAATGGHVEAVDFLLNEGYFIDSRDCYGRTPLYMAVLEEQDAIAKILLDNNANADAECRCGTTALSKAAEYGNLDVLYLLLLKEVRVGTRNLDGESPEELAWHNGHEAVLSRINHYKTKRVEAFLEASKKGCVGDMQKLMASGADPRARDRQGDSAFDLASQNGHTDAMLFLLQIDAGIGVSEPDGRGRGITPLHRAAQNGHEKAVNLLLEHGAQLNSVNRKMMTPLHQAAQRGHTEVISAIWRQGSRGAGVNLDVTGPNWVTPLMLAAAHHRTTAVERLLELGADHSLKDGRGQTAWDKWQNGLD